MNIETLKQGLQQILNEDISNRSSISELRRNVFLQTSKSEESATVLVSKEKTISDLTSDIDYYKNQLVLREKSIIENTNSYQAERDSLLDVINEKENKISALSEQLERLSNLESQVEEKNTEINRLLVENSNYGAKIRETEAFVLTLEENKEQTFKELASLKVKADWADKFKRELENSKLEENKLQAMLVSERQSNESMKIQLSSLENEIQNLRTANENLTERLNESEVLVSDFKEQASEVGNQIEFYKSQNEDLQLKNCELSDSILHLENAKLDLAGINASLQQSNFDLVNELNSSKLSSAETIEVLREELVQMENLSVETINNLSEEIKRLNQQLIEFQTSSAKSEELNRTNKELTSKIQLLEQQIITLGIQLEERASAKQLSDTEILELKVENERIQTLILETQQKLSDATAENAKVRAESQKINDSLIAITEKQQVAEINFQEVSVRCTELKAINESLSSFRENYITAQQQISDLERQLVENQMKLSESVPKDELHQLFTKNEQLKSELSSLQHSSSAAIEKAELSLKEAQDRIVVLESDFAEVKKSQLIENAAEVEALNRVNNRLSDDIEILNKRVIELESLNAELTSSVSLLDSSEVSRLQVLADQLNTEKLRLEETVTDLKRELFKAEEKLSTMSNEQISDQLQAVNEENIQLSQQKKELENQVAELLGKLQLLGKTSDNHLVASVDLEKSKNSVNLASVLNVSLEDKKTLKLKINELVKEIDRCIAMLNAQS
jgi:DNA repair exonuclease SbcCD ATPase subunit